MRKTDPRLIGIRARTRHDPTSAALATLGSLAFAVVFTAHILDRLEGYRHRLVEARLAAATPERLVAVPIQDLQPGHVIAPWDLVEIPMPRSVVQGVVATPAELVGRVVFERLIVREPVREPRLAPADSTGIEAILAEGTRAVKLDLWDVSQVSGYVEAGDWVDLVATPLDPVTGEVLGTVTVVEGAKVLAADHGRGQRHRNDLPPNPSVTLQLNAEDAEQVAFYYHYGNIRLVWRADIDFTVPELPEPTQLASRAE
ncbi:MAG: Flp pilus assembly protein CpaB [Myxococcota bacterium]